MEKIVRYLCYACMAFMVLFSCAQAMPDSLDAIDWEKHENSMLEQPEFNEEVMPEVVRPFAADLAAIKQRYYNGAAMSKKIDHELREIICNIHNEVRKAVALDEQDAAEEWVKQYKIDIYNERFMGAMNTAHKHRHCREVSSYVTDICIWLEALEADARNFSYQLKCNWLYKKNKQHECRYISRAYNFMCFWLSGLRDVANQASRAAKK